MEYKKQEIKEYFIESLRDIRYFNGWGAIQEMRDNCELHHEIFNMDYYIIGTYKAKQWLGDKALDIIGYIKEYEMDNFGELYTDLTSAENIVNMYVYIIGEEIVSEFENMSSIDQYETTKRGQK